ncbi:MAG: riboflavin biosynthesis protein RibF [Candidatus Aenigmarchaeota archaeon]|nr:riboflavin biosynthesis protein RibF [Candidatus Aenigmarchaeota archaeon]
MATRLRQFRTRRPAAVTVGTFDGVHKGHSKIIRQTVAAARHAGLQPLALTFAAPPASHFGQQAKPLLLPLPARLRLIGQLGARPIVVDFRDVADYSPEQFVADVLVARLRAKVVVASAKFRFGKGRRGNLATLRRLGRKYGFAVLVAETARIAGRAVSSTAVRAALAAGDIAKAESWLGYRPLFIGMVVKGHGVGRSLGFPTLNLDIGKRQLVPAEGIYACWIRYGTGWHKGALYIGRRPTFRGGTRSIEVYVISAQLGRMAGRTVAVELVARVRGDKRFASRQQLQAGIAKDVQAIKRLLSRP